MTVAEIAIPSARAARVYEHGWQSWSPTGCIQRTRGRLHDRSAQSGRRWPIGRIARPRRPASRGRGCWPSLPRADGPVTSFLASHRIVPSHRSVPSSSTAACWSRPTDPSSGSPGWPRSMPPSLPSGIGCPSSAATADPCDRAGLVFLVRLRPGGDRRRARRHARHHRSAGLDVRVVQIDDGYQAAIGDWLEPSGRIASIEAAAARIIDTGRMAGIWTSPLLVGESSRVAREHPDWLVGDALAAEHWGDRIRVLDVTHPDAADHLARVFRTLRAWGGTPSTSWTSCTAARCWPPPRLSRPDRGLPARLAHHPRGRRRRRDDPRERRADVPVDRAGRCNAGQHRHRLPARADRRRPQPAIDP